MSKVLGIISLITSVISACIFLGSFLILWPVMFSGGEGPAWAGLILLIPLFISAVCILIAWYIGVGSLLFGEGKWIWTVIYLLIPFSFIALFYLLVMLPHISFVYGIISSLVVPLAHIIFADWIILHSLKKRSTKKIGKKRKIILWLLWLFILAAGYILLFTNLIIPPQNY